MYRIAVCFENRDVLNRIKEIARSSFDEMSADILISPSADGLLELLAKNKIALDILVIGASFERSSGAELAAAVCEQYAGCQVVFVGEKTSPESDLYNVPHIWHIAVPCLEEKLPLALNRAAMLIDAARNDRMEIRINGRSYMLMIRDIIYFEQYLRKVRILTKHGFYDVYNKVEHYARVLEKYRFVQCHKSFVVNLNEAVEISRKNIVLSNNEVIPISSGYLDNVRKHLFR